MKIEITEKGIKPEDLFKILNKEYIYICCNLDGNWLAFKQFVGACGISIRPSMYGTYCGKGFFWSGHGELSLNEILKIDYNGKPEDSLFFRGDYEN